MGWNKGSTESFAGRVRAAARKLGADGNEFSAGDLSHEAGVQTFDGNKRLHWVIRDLKNAGELVVVHKGIYRLNKEPQNLRLSNTEPKKVEGGRSRSLREIMWRFLRMRKVVTVGDLQEASGAAESYASEWLRMLSRQEVVKKLSGGRWQLVVTDVLDTPHDLEKAEKLRKMRAERKEKLLGLIDSALIRIGQAQLQVSLAKDELVALDAGEVNP